MEELPTRQNVIGKFDGKTFRIEDVQVTSLDRKRTERVSFDVRPFEKDGKYFFTIFDRDNPRNDQTYEITKTLGGKWDQGYEISIGPHFFPAILRYSVAGEGWWQRGYQSELWIEPDGTPDGRPRRPEELPTDFNAETKCAGCHTTGYSFKKNAKGVYEMTGRGELGIACEKCHGPGEKHVAATRAAKQTGTKLTKPELHIVHGLKDLDQEQQTQLCGQCHGRGASRHDRAVEFVDDFLPGDRDLVDKFLFWNFQSTRQRSEANYFYKNNWSRRNRQQWQDHLISAHSTKAEMSCLSCHAFHGKWEGAQLREKPQALCTSCHRADEVAARPQHEYYSGSAMDNAGVKCADCHMARIGTRSSWTEQHKATKEAPWDVSAHHYMVATPALKKLTGMRSACESCHTKGREIPPWIESWASPKLTTNDDLADIMEDIQDETKEQIRELQAAFKREKTTPEARDAARMRLKMVIADGSYGFHNPDRTKKLLAEARALLDPLNVVNAQPRIQTVAVETASVSPTSAPPTIPSPIITPALVETVPAPAIRISGRPLLPIDGPRLTVPTAGAWYVTRQGDMLSKIAKQAYGDRRRWTEIKRANGLAFKQRPAALPKGTVIFIPVLDASPEKAKALPRRAGPLHRVSTTKGRS
jgi:predicted CXXCH cytochrome family protein